MESTKKSILTQRRSMRNRTMVINYRPENSGKVNTKRVTFCLDNIQIFKYQQDSHCCDQESILTDESSPSSFKAEFGGNKVLTQNHDHYFDSHQINKLEHSKSAFVAQNVNICSKTNNKSKKLEIRKL